MTYSCEGGRRCNIVIEARDICQIFQEDCFPCRWDKGCPFTTVYNVDNCDVPICTDPPTPAPTPAPEDSNLEWIIPVTVTSFGGLLLCLFSVWMCWKRCQQIPEPEEERLLEDNYGPRPVDERGTEADPNVIHLEPNSRLFALNAIPPGCFVELSPLPTSSSESSSDFAPIVRGFPPESPAEGQGDPDEDWVVELHRRRREIPPVSVPSGSNAAAADTVSSDPLGAVQKKRHILPDQQKRLKRPVPPIRKESKLSPSAPPDETKVSHV